MKALHKMDNLDKARIVLQAIPEEMENIQKRRKKKEYF